MKNLTLAILATILLIILLPISIVYSVFKTKKEIKVLANEALFKYAFGVDQMGNSVCYLLFNDLFLVDKSIYPFGSSDETISSVLGRNKLQNNLSTIGKALDKLLDTFDKNHSIKSIGQ